MATYYRWRRRSVSYSESDETNQRFQVATISIGESAFIQYAQNYTTSGGYYVLTHPTTTSFRGGTSDRVILESQYRYIFYGVGNENNVMYIVPEASMAYFEVDGTRAFIGFASGNGNGITKRTRTQNIGTGESYVYSTNSSAYPNGGVSGGYYYDQRTTVTSPTAPTNIQYPNPIITTSVTINWDAATSNVPDVSIEKYWVGIYVNGASSPRQTEYSSSTSTTIVIPTDAVTVSFGVEAVDSNGEHSSTKKGANVNVIRVPGTPSVSAPATAVSGESITVNWETVSGATSYTVQRNTGGGWTQVYSGNALTFSETVGVWDSLQYRVQGVNAAGGGSWGYSDVITVYISPTLTVPQMVMQGQSATVTWSAIEGADSYTLQRKSSADTDWVQVYSGANLTFSETVGTWTTVQYRVQAVFDGTAGGWAESAAIPVVSASSLVISGTDEDLGVVTNDIPYSISTDTGNQITATITVNNAVIFSGNVGNSTADVIPVLDLITGEGTIVISATVDASGSPVTATRTWTYEKAAITFPNSGSVAQVTKEGENIYPKVLAEGVRLPGGKTLDQVMGFPCQIYAGSYVGTGTSGASNPNTLTFPFEPKILFISTIAQGSMQNCGWIYGCQYGLITTRGTGSPTNYQIDLTWGENSITWYATQSADPAAVQLNSGGITYKFVAIG